MQNPNDNPTNQTEPLAITQAQLRNIISDVFHDLLSSLTPVERSKEIESLVQVFPLTQSPQQNATIKTLLPVLTPKTYHAVKKTDLKF